MGHVKIADFGPQEMEEIILEITANAIQLVEQGQNVLFTETAVKSCKPCIKHREGAGVVTLRGLTNQCNARFLVNFSGNIAIPTGGTAEEISLAIAIEGEPLQSTRMRVTPAALDNYFNVSSQVYVDVPRGYCTSVAVENVSGQAINVQNANLIVTREA